MHDNALPIGIAILWGAFALHVVFLFIFKREDVSIEHAFTFQAQHGPLWNLRNPELYFKPQYAKWPNLLSAVAILAVIVTCVIEYPAR